MENKLRFIFHPLGNVLGSRIEEVIVWLHKLDSLHGITNKMATNERGGARRGATNRWRERPL